MKSKTFARELLASIVVFLVALPLCMGIAIASGAPPAMGLVSGIIGGIVVGSLAGSPLQVSGPAAGLAVIVFDIIQQHGLIALPPVVLLAGLIQVAAGMMRIGQWFRAVAPAVIYGMLAGIGVLIFASQFHVMVDDAPAGSGLMNLITIPQSILKGVTPVEGTAHHLAAGIGLLTLIVLVAWNGIRPRLPTALGTLPAPLLAVGAATAAAAAYSLPIQYVIVPEGVDTLISFPELSAFSLLLQPSVLGAALALACIASAESLLCASAVDKLHSGVRTNFDRELLAQGVGNMAAGIFGGLPVTGVIVRSTANVEAGSTTRVSAVLHGIWLLIMVLALPNVLALIPVASLAAVLVYIGWKLVKPDVMRQLWSRSRAQFAIYAITVTSIVGTNLLEGLLIGLAVSVLHLAWTFSHLEVTTEPRPTGEVDVTLHGAATFVRLPALANALEALPNHIEVHIHLESLRYIDHACLELISDWERQREASGGKLVMEWEAMEHRSKGPNWKAA